MRKIGKWNSGETTLFYVCCPDCGDIIYEETSDNSGYRNWKEFSDALVGCSFWCDSCNEEYEIVEDDEVDDE